MPAYRIVGTIEVEDTIVADDLVSAIESFCSARGVKPDRIDGRIWVGFCSHCGVPIFGDDGHAWDLDAEKQWCWTCMRKLRKGRIVE